MKLKAKIKKVIVTAILYFYFFFMSINVFALDLVPEEINSASAILIDQVTGAIIYQKNPNEKKFPASTTKIMTALLTLEKAKNLNQRIKMSHNAIYNLEPGSSHIAMNEGETLTIEQALNALLIASANEVANALAEYISGDINNFCKLMNQRAKELGCKNTHFINAHGFHNDDHYTSAYDLSLIMREAVKHKEFNKIINTQRYDIPPTEKQSQTRVLYNTNKMIQNGRFFYKNLIGGKTGYTDEAKHTLVSYAEKNGMKIICVVMGAENSDGRYFDTQKIFDYGFEKGFYKINLLDKEKFSKSCIVTQEYKNKLIDIDLVNILLERDIKLNLPVVIKKEDLKLRIKLPKRIKAPVKKNKSVGYIAVIYKNKIISKEKLFAEEDINLLDKKVIARNELKKLVKKICLMSIKILLCACVLLLLIRFIMGLMCRINFRRKRNKQGYKFDKKRFRK